LAGLGVLGWMGVGGVEIGGGLFGCWHHGGEEGGAEEGVEELWSCEGSHGFRILLVVCGAVVAFVQPLVYVGPVLFVISGVVGVGL